MNLLHAFTGRIRLRLTGADIAATLRAFNAADVHILDVIISDALTAELTIYRKDWSLVRQVAARRGDDVRVVRYGGAYWSVKKLLHRPVLVLGILLILILSLYLPTKILFIRVEGNSTVPANRIIEKASLSGIRFGTDRRAVRSEKVKNALLEAMPELQWAGINTSGCVAVITVRERPEGESGSDPGGASSLVASRDGIIRECTATKGQILCQPGQAVRAGQVLISGRVDTGMTVRLCRAEGEIYAITERVLELLIPTKYTIRREYGGQTEKYALLLGKKRINFYKGSGISGTTCVRMYSEKYMTLPGGFRLPVALIRETWIDHSVSVQEEEITESQAKEFAADLLRQQLAAGRILSGAGSAQSLEGFVLYSGKYQCCEQISIRKNEEIIKPNE